MAALTVQGFSLPELKLHIKAALRCGASRGEVAEIITQMIAYCGFPAATNALMTMKEVFDEIDAAASRRSQEGHRPERGANERRRNGASCWCSNLEAQGVEYVFGIPGAKIDPVFDALLDSKIKTVVCRHEQNAAFIAGGLGRITGKAGVVLVTSGPGCSNLVTGLGHRQHRGRSRSSPWAARCRWPSG